MSDIPTAVKSRDVLHIVSDEDGNEISRNTESVVATSAYAVIVGRKQQYIGANDTGKMWQELAPESDNEDMGAEVARLIKIDPQTALPKWGSDFSPHYIRATQLARLRSAGLIREG